MPGLSDMAQFLANDPNWNRADQWLMSPEDKVKQAQQRQLDIAARNSEIEYAKNVQAMQARGALSQYFANTKGVPPEIVALAEKDPDFALKMLDYSRKEEQARRKNEMLSSILGIGGGDVATGGGNAADPEAIATVGALTDDPNLIALATFKQNQQEKATEKAALADKTKKSTESTLMGVENVKSAIDEARNLVKGGEGEMGKLSGWSTTGITGAITANIPGTPAFNLAKTVDTIKANIGFDRLQRMRDESPTGGALGSVAIQELNYLQNSIASLEQAQDEKLFLKNLSKVEKQYEISMRRLKKAYEEDYGTLEGFEQFSDDMGADKLPTPAPAQKPAPDRAAVEAELRRRGLID